jgi:RecB family endonuclease NucS
LQLKEHSLNKTEVKWGLISVSGIREYFPQVGEKVVLVDEEGKQYDTRMHKTAARIDGLTDWHKTHQTKVGDIVTININPDKSVKLSVRREGQTPQQESESEDEPLATEIVPDLERLVEDFLEKNLNHVEKGLVLYKDENKIPGRQYSTDIGTIDLLCLDKNKDFVVIEIKRDKGSDATVGQITRYMGWVKQKLANKQPVRGIIIAHEREIKLEFSASVVSSIEIKYYKIDLRFVSKEELSS